MKDLPFLDAASPAFSTRSEEVRRARARSWCARTPYGLAVLRHREVGRLLRDRRLRQGSHGWPRHIGLEGSFAAFWTRSVIAREGEPHRRLRRLANDALSPAFVETLKPAFADIAERLAAALPARVEFQSAFAMPFAGQAIAALLGLPPGDWPALACDATTLGLAMGVEGKRCEARVNAACDRLTALAARLVARARAGEDRESYAARLTANFDACPEATEQELLDMMVISIFGGVDTTRAQLGHVMSLFADAPEEWAKLRADPALAAAAIEESIRARPTTTWATREALEDFTHEGVVIRRGETLHLFVHASARDPEVCDDPAFRIDAERKIHFGFGGGAHHCLGAAMARADMTAALTALAARIAAVEPGGEAEFLPDSGNTGPVRLPLRLRFA